MAFLPKTAFEARVTNNEWENLVNVTGRYQAGSPAADADCSAGFLVVTGEKLPCEGFTGVKNENAYYMSAAPATANIDSIVYACNTYESEKLANGENRYYLGHATLGLGIHAGELGTYTRVYFDNEKIYRFGVGNTSDEGESDFYTIEAGLLKAAEAAPTDAGSIYFKVEGTGVFTTGAKAGFGYVDVRACRVSVAA